MSLIFQCLRLPGVAHNGRCFIDDVTYVYDDVTYVFDDVTFDI